MGLLQEIERALSPSAPQKARRAFVLFNEKAGGVRAEDREKLATALAEAGVEDAQFIEPHQLSETGLAKFKRADVVIVLGGDGTARSMAERAPRDGPPLILLPGGTLNVLPRALYGELAWPEALKAALERGVVRRLAMGRANGKPFFVAAAFGAPTLLARAREAVREGRYLRALQRFRHFLDRSFTRKLRARPGGAKMEKAECIGVLCPAYSGAVEGESLEWVRLDPQGLVDLTRLGLRSFGSGWRDDPAVDLHECMTGDIVSPGMIPATLDGEPHMFVSRVKISFDQRGPRVIALPQDG